MRTLRKGLWGTQLCPLPEEAGAWKLSDTHVVKALLAFHFKRLFLR